MRATLAFNGLIEVISWPVAKSHRENSPNLRGMWSPKEAKRDA